MAGLGSSNKNDKEAMPIGEQNGSGDNRSVEKRDVWPGTAYFSVLDVLLVLVQQRRVIGWTVLVITCIAFIFAVIPEEPEYEATATVIREEAVDGTSGTLSRLGIGIGNRSGSGLTAIVYPDILSSREVRLAVARDTFELSSGRQVTLVDYTNVPMSGWDRFTANVKRYTIGLPTVIADALAPDGNDPQGSAPSVSSSPPATRTASDFPTRAEERAMSMVKRVSFVRVNQQTGLMTLGAKTNDPALSAGIVMSLLEHLQQRVRELRSGKAKLDLAFVESRLDSAEVELRQAEEDLARFLDRNTAVTSARLQTEVDRLQRTVQFKSQMYSTLQNEKIQAEVELQRSKPVVTILERPVPPRTAQTGSPTTSVMMGILLGLFLGVCLAFAKWYFAEKQSIATEREKLDELKAAIPFKQKLPFVHHRQEPR